MKVQRLAASYRRLLDMLQRLSPRADGGGGPPGAAHAGPYTETYFEHVPIWRVYLGIPLAEGSDLTVARRNASS